MAEDKTYTQDELDELIDERNKALEKKHAKAMDQLKGLKRDLAKFDGVDLDELSTLRATVQELQAGAKGVSSDELKKIRDDVRADIVRRFADPKIAAEELPWAADVLNENRGLKLDSVVKAEMARHGARAERIDALFTLTKDRFDLTADGKPTLREHPGVEVGTYVSESLKTEYPEFYNGSGSSGGGATGSNAGGGGHQKTIAANDPDAFMANLEAIASNEVQVES